MKTAVSIPQDIYESAEKLAKRLGRSRSQLYTRALKSYVAKQNSDEVTKRLDKVYGSTDSAIDLAFRQAQLRSLSKDEW